MTNPCKRRPNVFGHVWSINDLSQPISLYYLDPYQFMIVPHCGAKRKRVTTMGTLGNLVIRLVIFGILEAGK